MSKIAKAYAITDAKISFVSLVNKAANKKQFLITKSENGAARFSTYGRILKMDSDSHFVTGIVYEPMVEEITFCITHHKKQLPGTPRLYNILSVLFSGFYKLIYKYSCSNNCKYARQ